MIAWIILFALVILAIAGLHRRPPRSSRRDQSQQEHDASLRRLGFRTLHEYRQSELWCETKRRYRRSKYPQQCLVCGSKRFDLHHRSYARLGAEEMFDLVPLCRCHHDQLHQLLGADPRTSVKDTHDFLPLLMRPCSKPPMARKVRRAPVEELSPHDSERPRRKRRFDIKEQRYRGGQKWMPEEDAELLKDFDAGVSMEELAKRLRRGGRAVEVRLFQLGRVPHGPSEKGSER